MANRILEKEGKEKYSAVVFTVQFLSRFRVDPLVQEEKNNDDSTHEYI